MKLDLHIGWFSGISDLDRILFAKHLAVMVRGGIGLAEAIETLIAQTKSAGFRRVLQRVHADIENGQSLSRAVERYPDVFDSVFVNLIRTGEQSGTLVSNLEYLANQLTRAYAFRGKVRSATLYPTIVLILAVVVGLGISVFALPRLLDIFSSFDIPLPFITRVLIFFATIFKNYGITILALVLVGVGAARGLVTIAPIRRMWHLLVLKIPVAGPVIQNSELVFLCRNIGTMIQSGLPVMTALDIQRANTNNMIYREYLTEIKGSVAQGKSIGSQFSHTRYPEIPPIMEKMLRVGDKTGKLDEMFIYLSNYFEDEVDMATKNISVVLEPALLFVITVAVGFVAMAIILPIYQLTGSIR